MSGAKTPADSWMDPPVATSASSTSPTFLPPTPPPGRSSLLRPFVPATVTLGLLIGGPLKGQRQFHAELWRALRICFGNPSGAQPGNELYPRRGTGAAGHEQSPSD